MNGTTGAVVTGWGNAGIADGTFIYSANYVSGGSTYPLAITVGSPRAAVRDAFVVGFATANASGTDTDGVVLPIDVANGHAFDAGWNFGFAYRYISTWAPATRPMRFRQSHYAATATCSSPDTPKATPA